MDGTSPALPSEWIGRLFGRFRAIYGNKVDVMYGSTSSDPTENERQTAELMATWATELGRYAGEDLRRALEAMRFSYKDFPPTLFQFADLCRDAMRMRAQTAMKVEVKRYGGPSPEVLAEIHKVSSLHADRKRDPKDWARRILEREANGERMPMIALTSAREALGVA